MKVRLESELVVKVGYRIPVLLKKAVEEKALQERRSINDQVIVMLEQALIHKEEK